MKKIMHVASMRTMMVAYTQERALARYNDLLRACIVFGMIISLFAPLHHAFGETSCAPMQASSQGTFLPGSMEANLNSIRVFMSLGGRPARSIVQTKGCGAGLYGYMRVNDTTERKVFADIHAVSLIRAIHDFNAQCQASLCTICALRDVQSKLWIATRF